MGGPIRGDILYKQKTMALKRIETKAMPQVLPDKCEAIWYRSNDPDWNFKITGEEISWRASVKYLRVIIDKRLNFKKQVDYIRQKNLQEDESTEFTIGRQRKNYEDYLHSNYTLQSTLEYRAVTFGMMAP